MMPKQRQAAALPHVLTMAGSDSGGGAGIQADLKTFLALHTYGMSVITSLTAQNTTGVTAIHTPPAEFVTQQFETVAHDICVDAIKIGMLANAGVAKEVAKCVKTWRASNSGAIVLDTVMIATSGALLLEHDAVATIRQELFSNATLITPNLSEAVHLLKDTPHAVADKRVTLADMQRMAHALTDLGAKNALVKGGHAPVSVDALREQLDALGVYGVLDDPLDQDAHSFRRERNASFLLRQEDMSELGCMASELNGSAYSCKNIDVCFKRGPADLMCLCAPIASYTVDVLYEKEAQRTTLFVKPTVKTSATHGTGCTLSSAITAMCAHGHSLRLAIAKALRFMQNVLASGLESVGHGNGPLNHDADIISRGVPLRTPSNPAPLTTMLASHSWSAWRSYTRHPFVQQLGRGTLPEAAMQWFMQQDYMYLKQYARALSKAVVHPAAELDDMEALSAMAKSVLDEMQLHVRVCESMGISSNMMAQTVESRATVAYTRFFLDTADEGLLPLMVSLASCAIGYAEVGLWLKHERDAGNIQPQGVYDEWITEYSGSTFQDAIINYVELMEEYTQRLMISEAQTARLQKIWEAATRFEIGMWDEALSVGTNA